MRFSAELNTKNKELASEIEVHKATKDSLEKAKRDVKKKSVLSLEMEDYERSLKELTAKMEEKKKKMVQVCKFGKLQNIINLNSYINIFYIIIHTDTPLFLHRILGVFINVLRL